MVIATSLRKYWKTTHAHLADFMLRLVEEQRNSIEFAKGWDRWRSNRPCILIHGTMLGANQSIRMRLPRS